TADERNGEGPFVDVVAVIGGGEHLGFVHVVHTQVLQHLGLDEVPDSGLGHDGDGDGLDDLGDQFRIAQPGSTALGADTGGDAFERHHRHGTGIFGDLGLLGGDHIHDHPTLEHVCHTAFDRGGATGGYRRFAGDWGVLGHWGPRQSLDNVTSLLPRGGAAA